MHIKDTWIWIFPNCSKLPVYFIDFYLRWLLFLIVFIGIDWQLRLLHTTQFSQIEFPAQKILCNLICDILSMWYSIYMLYMLCILLYSKILMPLTSSSLRFYHPFCTLVWMLMAGWHHKPSLNDINIKEWWKIGTISFRDESSEAVTAFSLLLALKDTDDAENKHCDGNRIWSKMKSQYDQNSNRIGPKL